MLNKRLALVPSLLCCASLAWADDVTVYGSANVEVGAYHDKRSAEVKAADVTEFKKLRVEDNTRGRIGVKAAENLGEGMSAIARFEWQLDTATNTGGGTGDASLTSRMSYVGLAGGFGTVMAGKLKSPYKYAGGVKYDPFVTTALEARGHGGMTAGIFGHEGFIERMVGYASPRSALSGRIAYGLEEEDNALSLDLLYRRGWGEAFVAYVDAGNRRDDAGLSLDYKAVKVGGQYRSPSEAHQLSLQYEYIEDASASTTVKPSVWFLGYQFKAGKGVLAVQLGRADKESLSTKETSYAALGGIYKFTKTTRAYAGYRYSKDMDEVFTFGLRKDFDLAQ